MNHTFYGATGRAQVTVVDLTGASVPLQRRRESPEFQVRLLPRSASRSTAYTSAGDLTYSGSDLSKALMHVRAWTGLEEIDLPAGLRKYLMERERAS